MTTVTVPLPPLEDGEPRVLEVVGLERAEWAALVDAHPPRPGTKDHVWNGTTFPPALIAACTGVGKRRASQWWEDAADDEAYLVFEQCVRASTPGTVEWAKARLRDNGRTAAEVRVASRMGIPRSEFLKWPNDDQDYAIAEMALEGDRCPGGCGAAASEMNDRSAWQVVPSTCVWCRALEAARDGLPAERRSYTHLHLIRPRGKE